MTFAFTENIQRGIIYLLKSDKDFYLQIVNLVKPEYFEYNTHTAIFKVVQSYYDKYKKLPNDDFILEEIKGIKNKNETFTDYSDEIEYINNLDTSNIENKDYYLDLIEKFARKEAMKMAIAESIQLIKDGDLAKVEDIVRKALLISRTVDNGQSYFEDIIPRWRRALNEDKSLRFKTILPKLNDVLEGGLMAKELAMVVAPPGVGKSLFLVNQGVEFLKQEKKVLYISLEMSEDRIAQRFDSVMTLIPQGMLKKHQDSLNERLTIFQKEFPMGKLIIKEFPTGRANANTIRALLNQLRNYEEFIPDVIIVDYLELLRPTTDGMPEYQAQERIAQELRGIGVENNCLMWTATQTNREGSRVNIITEAELGDSFGKIRTADFALSLNQTTEEFDAARMRGYIMKSRNSRGKFIIPMRVDYNTLRMMESEPINDPNNN